ncbi:MULTISPECIES: helix-turn-helix transcriptional regulator [Chryseobacterium]|uniref:XRE family transcriptional regulator n=1 Tax=Chryseobacterium bernardetii TaxID=1241978 RepID=A0A3G6U593_9FLAO|nr:MULTISPECIES: helix-turn-helix transcriptional regulator [Chryseobacterium]AZB23298.1 XRE family transcriptional regulator [Chryseobacterium bernardetii]AZB34076.1 XRE family transcriptional regulator [Chryseobacterium bernardetii]UCA62128.1 helix-turn-helix transcriptional regulator [Chryseobacterium rhizoplanae]
MKKAKLRTIRKQKGYSQQQVADVIPTEVSNYSRKENGYIKITKNEWEKIARFFNVPVEEIYEEDYPVYIPNGISRDNIHAYISQLEKENIALLKKIEILKNIINH